MLVLWMEFGDFPFTSATLALKIIGHCLSYANSSVNPLIYAFVSNQFRKDFRSICPCRKISRVIGSIRLRTRTVVTLINGHFQEGKSAENLKSRKKADRKCENKVREAACVKTSNDSAENSNNTGMTNVTPTLGLNQKSSSNFLPQTPLVSHKNNNQRIANINEDEKQLMPDEGVCTYVVDSSNVTLKLSIA